MDMQNPAEVRAFSEQTRFYRRLFPVPFKPHSMGLQAGAFLFCLMDEVLENLAV
jgi:hypothetical protein